MQLWHVEECTGAPWARECQQYALAAASDPEASALSLPHTAPAESVIFLRKLWETVFAVVCLKVGQR